MKALLALFLLVCTFFAGCMPPPPRRNCYRGNISYNPCPPGYRFVRFETNTRCERRPANCDVYERGMRSNNGIYFRDGQFWQDDGPEGMRFRRNVSMPGCMQPMQQPFCPNGSGDPVFFEER